MPSLRLPSLTVTGLRFGLASLLGLLIIFMTGKTSQLYLLSSAQFLTLLTITLSTGMVALAIYYYGLKRTPARISSICELTWPLSAVLLDYFYFHRGLTLSQWLGAALLTLSITAVSRFKKVPTVGHEPTSLTAHVPETCVYTNFTTSAFVSLWLSLDL